MDYWLRILCTPGHPHDAPRDFWLDRSVSALPLMGEDARTYTQLLRPRLIQSFV